jgi:uroporphyrinogen-III synthase
MRVLVTRPEPEATATAARLAAAGHAVMVDPMLTIRPITDVVIPARAYQAVLATSANALRAVEHQRVLERLRAVPLLAVGVRTALTARGLGFTEARAADGSGVKALETLVLQSCRPEQGPLLYLAGSERAGALDEDLRAAGFSVDLVDVYRAIPAQRLHDATRAALSEARIDAVVLASARTAQAFVAASAGLPLGGVCAVCVSDAIARVIADAGFRRILVANAPGDGELIAVLAG